MESSYWCNAISLYPSAAPFFADYICYLFFDILMKLKNVSIFPGNFFIYLQYIISINTKHAVRTIIVKYIPLSRFLLSNWVPDISVCFVGW